MGEDDWFKHILFTEVINIIMLQTVKWIGQGKYATMPSPEKKNENRNRKITHSHTLTYYDLK